MELFQHPDLGPTYVKYHGGLDKYRNCLMMQQASSQTRDGLRQCLILWGQGGTGKSTWARTKGWPNPQEIFYKSQATKWWDGWNPQVHRCLIVDEVMSPCPFPMDQMKLLLDVHNQGFPVEVKGGTTWCNPQKVILISNFDPLTWFGTDGRQDSGWLRRIADGPENPVHVQRVYDPLYSVTDPAPAIMTMIWREHLPSLGIQGTGEITTGLTSTLSNESSRTSLTTGETLNTSEPPTPPCSPSE